jgi:hypothetical protein
MIYFKTVHLNFDNKASVEAAIRKNCIKRTTMLDIKSSISDIGTGKRFFGYEGKDALYFTRIRSSVEQLLPKMIVSLPKNETDSFYRIRLSIFPFLLYNMIFLIAGKTDASALFSILIIDGLFIGLFLLELNITTRRIIKAIENGNAN